LGFELEITPHDYPRVIAVFAGLPAQQAGLAVGDKLLAADNQSLLTLPLPAVDAAISDEVGRIVTFRVKKPSQPQLLTIKVKVAP
jgi:C-terminal processing protease CtpA/Prc